MTGQPASRIPERVVIVGNHPLASAIASGLQHRGNRVCIVAPPGNGDAGQEIAVVPCDLPAAKAVRDALSAAATLLGGIDQIVHAWVPDVLLDGREFMSIDEPMWINACEAGIEGAWRVAQAAVGHLRDSGGGTAVFVIPTLGMSGGPGFSMLATVAEAVRVLAKSCGQQWGQYGIRVYVVATAPNHWVGREAADTLLRAIGVPPAALGSTGDAEQDFAPLLSLLANDDAHFLTSATLVADGGMWMGA